MEENKKPVWASKNHLPVYGQWISRDTEFSSMFLIEISRGCPRQCAFCINRLDNVRYRVGTTYKIIELIEKLGYKKYGLILGTLGRQGNPKVMEVSVVWCGL